MPRYRPLSVSILGGGPQTVTHDSISLAYWRRTGWVECTLPVTHQWDLRALVWAEMDPNVIALLRTNVDDSETIPVEDLSSYYPIGLICEDVILASRGTFSIPEDWNWIAACIPEASFPQTVLERCRAFLVQEGAHSEIQVVRTLYGHTCLDTDSYPHWVEGPTLQTRTRRAGRGTDFSHDWRASFGWSFCSPDHISAAEDVFRRAAANANAKEILDRAIIAPYNCRPPTRFHGTGNLFSGMEIEVENPVRVHYPMTIEVSLLAERTGFAHYYLKHDGSLRDGFEIVTDAFSPAAWREVLPKFRLFLAGLRRLKFSAVRGGRAGLHTHMSRRAFHRNAQSLLCEFIYDQTNSAIWHAWSGRTQLSNYARYSLPPDWWDNMPGETESDKYLALRFCRQTLEVRLFRGSLNTSRVVMISQLPEILHNLTVQGERPTWPKMVQLMLAHPLPEVRHEARSLNRTMNGLAARQPDVRRLLEVA